jgi:hypothetical protein
VSHRIQNCLFRSTLLKWWLSCSWFKDDWARKIPSLSVVRFSYCESGASGHLTAAHEKRTKLTPTTFLR